MSPPRSMLLHTGFQSIQTPSTRVTLAHMYHSYVRFPWELLLPLERKRFQTSISSMIPAIAFSVPDISAVATIVLKDLDTGVEAACVHARCHQWKDHCHCCFVSYVAAGVAGAAAIVGGVSALGAAASGASASGAAATSPSFMECVTWFQGMAMNGMLSVNYPPVYRQFTKNFGFSTGIIPWTAMQQSIDSFRAATG
ncbi:hypothetical protein DID88_003813 [Monilinia fructigena]|uniref:Uncharacterized protein n=1 Tax=Monilinia fructigena TaxID=38457 RepID=A0A395IYH0_9HELO|nr:hypothetical protein DID88_003813 [Monilinia fructigena]